KGIVQEYISFYTSDYALADVSTDLSALELTQDKMEHLLKEFAVSPDDAKQLAEFSKQDFKREDIAKDLLAKFQDKKLDEQPLTLLMHVGLIYQEIRDAIVLAHWDAQGYKNEQYTDLHDFCERLELRCRNIGGLRIAAAIAAACGRVKAAIDDIVLSSGYCG